MNVGERLHSLKKMIHLMIHNPQLCKIDIGSKQFSKGSPLHILNNFDIRGPIKIISFPWFKSTPSLSSNTKIYTTPNILSSSQAILKEIIGIVAFTQFFAKLLTEKTPVGTRIQVNKDDFVGYVHSRNNGLATVLVTDKDYPSRVAFNILQKVVMDMDEHYSEKSKQFDAVKKDFEMNDLYLEMLKKTVEDYQDPVKTDKILKVKKDLEETKTVLNKALDSLLDRGEKLDTLVAKTDMLNDSAKDFYIKAKENNSCCTIL